MKTLALVLFASITCIAQSKSVDVKIDIKKEQKADFVAASLFNFAMSVADVETTAHGLKANHDCREYNPIVGAHPSRKTLYLSTMSLNAGITFIGWHLISKGHGKRIWTIPFSIGAIHGVLSGTNTAFCP